MSMFRRRLLMMAAASSQGGDLPAGWSETEYVYFDVKGKFEYIDTGIIGKPGTKIEVVEYGVHNEFSHDRFLGNGFFQVGYISGGFVFIYNSKEIGATAAVKNRWVKFIKDGIHNHATLLSSTGDAEEEVEVPDNVAGTWNTTKTLWIGRNNDDKGWPVNNNRCKMLKIWDEGVLVRDFIPVTDGTQEALYDRVTKTLFYKQTP